VISKDQQVPGQDAGLRGVPAHLRDVRAQRRLSGGRVLPQEGDRAGQAHQGQPLLRILNIAGQGEIGAGALLRPRGTDRDRHQELRGELRLRF